MWGVSEGKESEVAILPRDNQSKITNKLFYREAYERGIDSQSSVNFWLL